MRAQSIESQGGRGDGEKQQGKGRGRAGQRSLAGYSSCGHKESDTTEETKEKQQGMVNSDYCISTEIFGIRVKFHNAYSFYH